jgi:hypothetical protein
MATPMKSLNRLAGCILTSAIAVSAADADDPTRRATRLATLSITAESGFSVKSYDVESGTYYRWRIESDGLEEYKLVAPELFAESWIDQVVIEGREVKPSGLHAVEFDEEGAIDIWFVPVRPGTYRYYVDTLEDQGFSGEVIVR